VVAGTKIESEAYLLASLSACSESERENVARDGLSQVVSLACQDREGLEFVARESS
jgi:hypothetical protein